MSATIFEISLSGLEFQRARADAVAMNIANGTTPAKTLSELYKPVEVVATAQAGKSTVDVENISVEERGTEPNRIYDPEHPYADEKGFVLRPAIDSVREMVNLMTATRSYQANIQVMEAAKKMIQWAIESGAK